MTDAARPVTRHVVVMVTSSYPRFPGDLTGTFVEPIAHGVAARGHAVHLVAPWHPRVRRPRREGNVHFHFYRYAPFASLNVFGYAGALRADVSLRRAAWAAAPLALPAAWRTARRVSRAAGATVLHAHWAIPSGAVAAAAAGSTPLVVSLHGSDVFVAERHGAIRPAARYAFRRAGWVTACSEDLRSRAAGLGADAGRSEVVPYGVDVDRFRPDAAARARLRDRHGIPSDAPVVVAAGRFVRKKGFEHLIDAVAALAPGLPALRLALVGSGDLDGELRARAAERGIAERVVWPGAVPQSDVAGWLAAADVAAVPSVRDDAGNVDGLPNVVLEALASATPVVATPAGGIATVAVDRETALVVPERDAGALAKTIGELMSNPALRRRIGRAARDHVRRRHTWESVAERFERAYDRVSRRTATGTGTRRPPAVTSREATPP